MIHTTILIDFKYIILYKGNKAQTCIISFIWHSGNKEITGIKTKTETGQWLSGMGMDRKGHRDFLLMKELCNLILAVGTKFYAFAIDHWT